MKVPMPNPKASALLAVLCLFLASCGPSMAQPRPDPRPRPPAGGPPRLPAGAPGAPPPRGGEGPAQAYTIEQAVSEQAQMSTIAFSALAFMTGSFGADTFLPPGKAADYFGFQYMRDVDAAEGGHNMMFLTNIGNNVLAVLDAGQEASLLELAKEQEPLYAELAAKRLVLIKAFRDNMEGRGAGPLSQAAVESWVAGIFAIDGRLAFRRAEVYGDVAKGLSAAQKAALAKLRFGDSSTWPELPDQYDKRSMTHGQDVLFMTYASEFFSWYAGSETADVYFCPERHGTYFGGFYMKDYPAMGNRDYFIPTALTGDSGRALLDLLEPSQAGKIEGISVPLEPILARIVEVRTSISREFRRYLSDGAADEAAVMALSREYGSLDGRISYLMASSFAEVYKSLSPAQKAAMTRLRNQDVFPKGYYPYADPVEKPITLDASGLSAK